MSTASAPSNDVVERFRPINVIEATTASLVMQPDEAGGYVLYEDYARLRTQLASPAPVHGSAGVVEALTRARTGLAAAQHLIATYVPAHHWLPHLDGDLGAVKVALASTPSPASGQARPAMAEPVAWQRMVWTADDCSEGWSEWIDCTEDAAWWREQARLRPDEIVIRPLYAAPLIQGSAEAEIGETGQEPQPVGGFEAWWITQVDTNDGLCRHRARLAWQAGRQASSVMPVGAPKVFDQTEVLSTIRGVKETVSEWASSAFLAGEGLSAGEERRDRVNCYSDMCRLMNRMGWLEDQVSALAASPPLTVARRVEALPDAIRVPLHSLQADLDYIVGRLAQANDTPERATLTESVRDRLNAIETALAALHPFHPTHIRKATGVEYRLVGVGRIEAPEWEERFVVGATEGGPFYGYQPAIGSQVATYQSADGSLLTVPAEEQNEWFEALPALGEG